MPSLRIKDRIMTTPDPTKEIQLTNSTSAPVVLMLPTTSSQSPDANGTLVYEQNLEVLTSIDNATQIQAGQAETFVLDQTYIDPDTQQPEYSTIYDLLPCTADWFYPVDNIGVMQGFMPPISYPAQTVTADSATAFQNAGLFIQTIAAYPNSTLASGYAAAMNQAPGNASTQANGSADSSTAASQSITQTVDSYFQSTKGFKNVTLAAVVAVQSYYGTFPCVWGQGQKTATTTYYLYKSSGTATSFVGTIALTPPATLDVTKPNAGYQCVYTPASNGTDTTTVAVNTAGQKSLTYTGGLFVDNPDSDTPAIGVRGTFQIKSLFTSNPSDTDIIAVLSGTVDNATVIGFDQPQLSSDPSDTFWDTLFHPKNSAQVFQSIMQIGGFIMLVVFAGQMLWGAYKGLRNLGAAKEPSTTESLQSMFDKLKADLKADAQANIQKGGGDPSKVTDDPADALKQAGDSQTTVTENQKTEKLEDELTDDSQVLEEDFSVEQSMTMPEIQQGEKAAGEIQSDMGKLENASPTDLAEVNASVGADAPGVGTQVGTLTTEVGSQLGSSAKQEAQQELTDQQEAQTEEQNLEEEETSNKGGADDVDDDIDLDV
jgi:hypothetical protein